MIKAVAGLMGAAVVALRVRKVLRDRRRPPLDPPAWVNQGPYRPLTEGAHQ